MGFVVSDLADCWLSARHGWTVPVFDLWPHEGSEKNQQILDIQQTSLWYLLRSVLIQLDLHPTHFPSAFFPFFSGLPWPGRPSSNHVAAAPGPSTFQGLIKFHLFARAVIAETSKRYGLPNGAAQLSAKAPSDVEEKSSCVQCLRSGDVFKCNPRHEHMYIYTHLYTQKVYVYVYIYIHIFIHKKYMYMYIYISLYTYNLHCLWYSV